MAGFAHTQKNLLNIPRTSVIVYGTVAITIWMASLFIKITVLILITQDGSGPLLQQTGILQIMILAQASFITIMKQQQNPAKIQTEYITQTAQ